jgi:hypothetical protein
MSREVEIGRLAEGVRALFGPSARLINLPAIPDGKVVTGKLGFGVDGCIEVASRYVLVQITDVWPLPDRLIRARSALGPNTTIIILACSSGDATAVKIACRVADAACEHGFGLAVALPDGVAGIFPPGFPLPQRTPAAQEFGHIPRKLLDALDSASGFSPHFRRCATAFSNDYRRLTALAAPTFDDEFALLFKFATELAEGDRRLFCPVGQLYILKEWERSGVNPEGRDHVFHTFNNFILGAVLLVPFLADRTTTSPESFIADKTGVAQLSAWEVLWLFTCLFHDPGYVGEKLGATFNFNFGFRGVFEAEMEIPEVLARALQVAWDTYWSPARHDMRSLFQQLSGTWTSIRSDESIWAKFDDALKLAYFKLDGGKGLHSLLSGLRLIDVCSDEPRGVKHPDYNKTVTQNTSVIAALCMLFHDEKCRDIFERHGIVPISFELLPYAAGLMFVDALQEDRRDINAKEFPADGFLEDFSADASKGTVSVIVRMDAIPLRYWPSKIAEMLSVLRWINERSATNFSIDYQTVVGISFTPAPESVDSRLADPPETTEKNLPADSTP